MCPFKDWTALGTAVMTQTTVVEIHMRSWIPGRKIVLPECYTIPGNITGILNSVPVYANVNSNLSMNSY